MLDGAEQVNLPFSVPNGSSINMVSTNNHNAYASLGLTKDAMLATVAVIDTGARANLLNYEALPLHWRQSIQAHDDPLLTGAGGHILPWDGTLVLALRIGELYTSVTFGVVRGLRAKCILGTPFTNSYIHQIFPMDGKVRPDRSQTIPILTPDDLRTSAAHSSPTILTVDGRPEDSPQYHAIRAARPIPIPPYSTTTALVRCNTVGLTTVESNPRTLLKMRIMVPNGLAEFTPNQLATVMVSNLGPKAVFLPKHMVVSYATGTSPTAILAVEAYKEPPQRTEDTQDPTGTANWIETIDVDETFSSDRMDLLDALAPFS